MTLNFDPHYTLVNLHFWPLLTQQIIITLQDQGCLQVLLGRPTLKCKCIQVWSLGNIHLHTFAIFSIYIYTFIASQKHVISSKPVFQYRFSQWQATFYLGGFWSHSDPTNVQFVSTTGRLPKFRAQLAPHCASEKQVGEFIGPNDLAKSPGVEGFVGLIYGVVIRWTHYHPCVWFLW